MTAMRKNLFVLGFLALAPLPALAQQSTPALGSRPGASAYAPTPGQSGPLATRPDGVLLTLKAQLVEGGEDISRGLTWRVFRPEPGPDGKLPLVASAQGGTASFELVPGSYLIHSAFGRAGATKRVTVGKGAATESVVLDAGGLKLGATLADGSALVSDKLRYAIYDDTSSTTGDRPLITRDVKPNTVVRLKAGQYHVVSTYGNVNAIVRADVRVEAGKLTETAVEHNAAEITLKLVREKGGEALADTSWSILTESGDSVTEKVGPYAQFVLAEGAYAVVARNRDHIYQKELEVKGGKNEEVEVLAVESNEATAEGSTE